MGYKIQRYGWVPDLPDQRDYLFAAEPTVLQALPTKVDLSGQCPPVYDQGELGSCTANAIAAAIAFDRMKQQLALFTPSRLFIYYNERIAEGTKDSDSGAQIRDGIKSVSVQGVCAEEEWPYEITKFRDAPPQDCFDDAAKHTAVLYSRVPQVATQMKGCLAAGYPFVCGFVVYESFEDPAVGVATTGNAPMPGANEKSLGGHAVLCVGYDDPSQRFLVRNSWARRGASRAISRFRMPISLMAISPTTSGQSEWSNRTRADMPQVTARPVSGACEARNVPSLRRSPPGRPSRDHAARP